MTQKLNKYINQIKENLILLPDFQRKFVWTEIDTQIRLISSVLSSLPIGSILLLEGDNNEFVSKQIGRKNSITVDDNKDINYLLDGQQRLTVLTNVFSNNILKGVSNYKTELSHETLKTRFYIKFSGINSLHVRNDLFGLTNLVFSFDPLDEPNFSSNEIFELIHTFDVTDQTKNPFSPDYDFLQPSANNELEDACKLGPDSIIVPLHFISENSRQLRQVVKCLTDSRQRFLIGLYELYDDVNDREEVFNQLYLNSGVTLPNDYLTNISCFKQFIHNLSEDWGEYFVRYLTNSINEIKVNEMLIKKAARSRAIDIYENLNLGGVSLSTFDLIIAKAARKMSEGFYESFKETLGYGINVPNFYDGRFTSNQPWIPKEQMNIYTESKNQVSSIYINVFLNLLSLVVNTRLDKKNLGVELMKKSIILKLKSEQIVDNYKKCIDSINRALMFLQMNCGIRKIDDISYEHILLGLSYFFYDDDIFNSRELTDLLEFWYWSSILSGTYDSDQNTNIINDISYLNNVIYKSGDIESSKRILKSRKNDVFNSKYFSDLDTLLMRNSEIGKLPKSVISKSICQYVLKKRPKDFIEDIHLNAWSNLDLDVHHVVPLRHMTSLKESTFELRRNRSHILNSPLNLVFILKSSNNAIGAQSPESYFRQFEEYIRSYHLLPNSINLVNPNGIEDWLKERFRLLNNSMMIHLSDLVNNGIIS